MVGILVSEMKKKEKREQYAVAIVFSLAILAILIFFYNRQIRPNVLGTTDTTVTPVGGKEFFVPLGTGTNASTDWTDVKGVAAYIDSRLYGKVKKVMFEASVSVPSGTASVRLFNATDKHTVWYSELSMSGSGPELLVSSPILLDSGNKLYQVQMKSQLGATTNLLQARVHIITY